jgi:hypothetical protein
MNPRLPPSSRLVSGWPARALGCVALSALALSAGGSPAAQEATHLLYVTRPGDTLIGLGERLLNRPGDWHKVQRLNRIADPRRMPVGTSLRIPTKLLRMEPAPANVATATGTGQAGGRSLAAGAALTEGSTVTTGDDGYISIRLADGSLLNLQPRSALKLESLRAHPSLGTYGTRLGLERGRVEVEAAAQRSGSRQLLRTPGVLVAVRGTRYRAAAPSAERGVVEVTEGQVGLGTAARARRIVLPAGYGVVATAGKLIGAPVPLPAAPDLSGISELQERVTIRVRFPAVPGAAAYRAQLATDAGFQGVVAEQVAAANDFRFAGLPDGDYWLRVRGIDAGGIEGIDAVRALQLRARPEPPFPSAPADGAKFRGQNVSVSWSAAAEATGYVVQLASGASFEPPLAEQSPAAGATSLQLDRLEPADYRWRVASVRADGRRGPFSDPQRFQLRPPPQQPEPPVTDDATLRFAWAAEPGQRFEFQLAADPEFRTLLNEAVLDRPAIVLPKPAPGTYYMRVRATDPDGFVGPYTAVQRFKVPAPPPWFLLLFLIPLL